MRDRIAAFSFGSHSIDVATADAATADEHNGAAAGSMGASTPAAQPVAVLARGAARGLPDVGARATQQCCGAAHCGRRGDGVRVSTPARLQHSASGN